MTNLSLRENSKKTVEKIMHFLSAPLLAAMICLAPNACFSGQKREGCINPPNDPSNCRELEAAARNEANRHRGEKGARFLNTQPQLDRIPGAATKEQICPECK